MPPTIKNYMVETPVDVHSIGTEPVVQWTIPHWRVRLHDHDLSPPGKYRTMLTPGQYILIGEKIDRLFCGTAHKLWLYAMDLIHDLME